ncbi:hypothetical protein [Tsukamurella pseudospumae]|uniref:Uncharacterized protein n=1 Tax=Tsukamurella pseudospumae TaxID=239498 RepID=A0A138AEF9_9ACTN|nr:hypothetical protein [Tsukamurella pseudospumae]KXP08800.1 hypothetical protein AXK60_09040 [Tsukamurella pseudospumae]
MRAPTMQVTVPLPTGHPILVRTLADLKPLIRGLVPPDAVIISADVSAIDVRCTVALPEQLALIPAA